MSPALFAPSVRRMTTLEGALLVVRRLTAFVNPIPIAVPGEIVPLVCKSQLTPLNVDNKAIWSVVIGHCVKASPPKRVRPILSFGRPSINS